MCVSECLAYSCFTQLMKRMSQNFPNGGAMDSHFANMRSLIQVMDDIHRVSIRERETLQLTAPGVLCDGRSWTRSCSS